MPWNRNEPTVAESVCGCLGMTALVLLVPFAFAGFVKVVLLSQPFIERFLGAVERFWGL